MSTRPYIEAGDAAQAAAEPPVPEVGQRWRHRTEGRTVTVNSVWDAEIGDAGHTAVAVEWGDRGQCGTAMPLDVFHHAYEPEQPAVAPAPDPWPTIARLVAWLDDHNGSSTPETALRLLKVQEEAGEVAAAWIGVTGQNPRKGTTHTPGDVADELCDVIVAAMVALTTLLADPAGHFDRKIAQIAAVRLDTPGGES